MKVGRWITSFLTVCIFAAAGFALYELGNRGSVLGTPAPSVEGWQNVEIKVPVQVGAIVQTTLRDTVTAYGYVEPAPASTTRPAAEAHLSVPEAAVVSEVDCVEGQHVDKGQTLFVLDTRSADAAVNNAQQLVTDTTSINDRLGSASRADAPVWTQLFAQWQLNLARLELSQALSRRAMLTFVAPISGTISGLHVHPGEVASPSTPAVDLIDTDHLVLAMNVPAFLAPQVHLGQGVILPSVPHSTDEQVTFIDPTIDASTGMASVDAALSAPGLIPGQFIGANIVLQERNCLAVPAESIVRDSLGRAQIALVDSDQRAVEMRIVQTGIRDGDWVEVQSPGLQAGDKIVTAGAYGLITRAGIAVQSQ